MLFPADSLALPSSDSLLLLLFESHFLLLELQVFLFQRPAVLHHLIVSLAGSNRAGAGGCHGPSYKCQGARQQGRGARRTQTSCPHWAMLFNTILQLPPKAFWQTVPSFLLPSPLVFFLTYTSLCIVCWAPSLPLLDSACPPLFNLWSTLNPTLVLAALLSWCPVTSLAAACQLLFLTWIPDWLPFSQVMLPPFFLGAPVISLEFGPVVFPL